MNQNKTVIISCAGMGTRLGMEIPKALVQINGKPMIIRMLENLDNCKDVRIVVGYKAEEVIKVVNSYRKDIIFVFNHDYMNTGTGASVSLAMKHAKEFVLMIDGDLIIKPEHMEEILSSTSEFVGVCSPSTDDPVLTKIEKNNVIEFSRKEGQYEWTGVALIKSEHLKEGEGHVFQMLIPLLPLNYKLISVKEVDTINDFKNAEKWVKNRYIEE